MVYCSQCGAENPDSDKFCGQCGTRLLVPGLEYLHPQALPPPPTVARYRKKGVFIASLFRSGAVGAFYLAGIAVLLGISFVIAWISPPSGTAFSNVLLYFLFIVSALLFLVAALTHSIGYLGFFLNYGSTYSIFPLAFGVVAPVIFLVTNLFGIYEYSAYNYYYFEIWTWIGHIMVGIMFILMGISFILVGRFTGVRNKCIGTGITFVVSGALLIALLGFFAIAWFIVAISMFASGVVFLTAYSTAPPRKLSTRQRLQLPKRVGVQNESGIGTVLCQNCGNPLPDVAKPCSKCGWIQLSTTEGETQPFIKNQQESPRKDSNAKYCSKCGSLLSYIFSKQRWFCEWCGEYN